MVECLPSWSLPLASAPIVGRPATDGAAGAPSAPAGGAAPAPQSVMGGEFMLIMMGVLVFMIVLSMLSGRKERKRRAQMLGALSRHDRVQTTGGMIGTVVELHDDEVVLKVDDATNTKIRFARSAVASVLKKAAEPRPEAPEPVVASA